MTQANRSDGPIYNEMETTIWLAWLARAMQRHSRSIFLIEQLQPSWLPTRAQTWSYIIVSRLIWGVMIGTSGALVIQLLLGLVIGYANLVIWFLSRITGGETSQLGIGVGEVLATGQFALQLGLILGLAAGVIGGLIDVVVSPQNRSHLMPVNPSRGAWAKSLTFAVLVLVVNLLAIRQFGAKWDDEQVQTLAALVFALIMTPIVGLFWKNRSFQRNLQDEIHTVETIGFAWRSAINGIVQGFVIGLALGLVFGLGAAAILGWNAAWQLRLILGLIFGLFGGLIGAIVGGLRGSLRLGVRDLKTVPNQGIRLSLRTGSLLGGAGGVALGVMVGLVGGWRSGLTYGVLAALCIGLWFGGLDVIHHTIVRILLWRAGAMPWDYARFLDYAANELNFLQKVGGGYMFVHRYLLEYFATLAPMDQPPRGHGGETSTS